MRRVISFVFATALLVAGIALLCLEAFVAARAMPRPVEIGVVLAVVGGTWLWRDFLHPWSQSRR